MKCFLFSASVGAAAVCISLSSFLLLSHIHTLPLLVFLLPLFFTLYITPNSSTPTLLFQLDLPLSIAQHLPPSLFFFSLLLSLSLLCSLFCSRSDSSTCRQRERGDEWGAHMWGSPELPGQGRAGEERRRRRGGGGLEEYCSDQPASLSLSLSFPASVLLSPCLLPLLSPSANYTMNLPAACC